MPRPVTVRVPAKLNLALQVGPRRPDGYHDLATVFQAVSLYDEVTVLPAERPSVRVSGEGAADVPTDGDNLALRAAGMLADAAGVPGAVAVEIVKGIPVAGGMAGGSADAAAALVACDALWQVGNDRATLAALAARLGSDVPFALAGGTALGTGRGDRLADVLARGTYHWVLAFDAEGLSTPSVYAAFDDLGARTGPGPEAVLAALRAGDAPALGDALTNDLQAPALRLRPRLRRVLTAGEELGALAGLVSGSGPTVAFLARDGRHATELAAALSAEGVCRAVRRAHGPVPGARVVDPADRP